MRDEPAIAAGSRERTQRLDELATRLEDSLNVSGPSAASALSKRWEVLQFKDVLRQDDARLFVETIYSQLNMPVDDREHDEVIITQVQQAPDNLAPDDAFTAKWKGKVYFVPRTVFSAQGAAGSSNKRAFHAIDGESTSP